MRTCPPFADRLVPERETASLAAAESRGAGRNNKVLTALEIFAGTVDDDAPHPRFRDQCTYACPRSAKKSTDQQQARGSAIDVTPLIRGILYKPLCHAHIRTLSTTIFLIQSAAWTSRPLAYYIRCLRLACHRAQVLS